MTFSQRKEIMDKIISKNKTMFEIADGKEKTEMEKAIDELKARYEATQREAILYERCNTITP